MRHIILAAVLVAASFALQAVAAEHKLPAPLPEFKTPEQLAKWREEKAKANAALPISNSSLKNADAFFTGKPFVEDSGSYAFKYRNYDPELNRWTTSDPSGFPDGINNWLYTNNMVMTYIDSVGLDIYHINNPAAVNNLGHSGAIVGNEQGGGYDYYSFDDSNKVTSQHFDTRQDAFNFAKDNNYTRAEKWLGNGSQDDAARAATNAYNNTQYDWQNHNCWDMVNDMLTDADAGHVDYGPGPNVNYDLNKKTCWERFTIE